MIGLALLGLGKGSSFLVVFALAYFVDAALVGQYSVIFSFIIINGTIASLGLHQVIMKFSPIWRRDGIRVRNDYLILVAVSLIATCSFSTNLLSLYLPDFFLSGEITNQLEQSFVLITSICFLYALNQFLCFYQLAQNRSAHFLFFLYVIQPVSLLLQIIFFGTYFELGLEVVLQALLASYLVAVVFNLLFSEAIEFKANQSGSVNFFDIGVYALTVLTSSIGYIWLTVVDRFALSGRVAEASIGVYVLGLSMIGILSLIAILIDSLLSPKISALFAEKKPEKALRLYLQNTTLISYLMLPLVCILVIGSAWIGDYIPYEYQRSLIFFKILLIGELVGIVFSGSGKVLQYGGDASIDMIMILVCGAIGGIAVYWSAMVYGTIGVAFAVSALKIGHNIIKLGWIFKKLGFVGSPPHYLKKISLITMSSVGVISYAI